jgi:hypothetical protein
MRDDDWLRVRIEANSSLPDPPSAPAAGAWLFGGARMAENDRSRHRANANASVKC